MIPGSGDDPQQYLDGRAVIRCWREPADNPPAIYLLCIAGVHFFGPAVDGSAIPQEHHFSNQCKDICCFSTVCGV